MYLSEPLIKTNGFRLLAEWRDSAVPVSAGRRSGERTGRRAASPARSESVHRRLREEAQPADRSDARRRRDGVARVRQEAGEEMSALPACVRGARVRRCEGRGGARADDSGLRDCRVRRRRRAGTRRWRQRPAAAPSAEVRSRLVQGNVWLINAGFVNVAAQIGPDGVLVVDTGTEAMGEKILAEIKRARRRQADPLHRQHACARRSHRRQRDRSRRPGKSVISGNFAPQAGAAAANAAKIVAHENTQLRMTGGEGNQPARAGRGDADRHVLRRA